MRRKVTVNNTIQANVTLQQTEQSELVKDVSQVESRFFIIILEFCKADRLIYIAKPDYGYL